ncbi:MAG: capsule assembly Wzi family protein [Edaphobacter sp.]
MRKRVFLPIVIVLAAAATAFPQMPATPAPQASTASQAPYIPYGPLDEDKLPDHYGSTYIPVDSWVYPAMMRLYSMGYVDTMFLSMRPWTRRSVVHMIEESQYDIVHSNNEEAQKILAKLLDEFSVEQPSGFVARGAVYGLESAYTRFMGIGGTTLRDSYHLGQTINNDYGRPYQTGFNNITGFSTVNEMGRFSLYVRGEYQHSPAAVGYSRALATQLSNIDTIPYGPPNEPQTTIPAGLIAAQNPFRLVDASRSFQLLGHEISGGKTDAWLSPAAGGAMAWSNNAENIYSFRINRVEPLHILLLSNLVGPVRYDFFIGSLKGHTAPNSPWVHSEMFAFRPSVNFEFGFQRTIIFGGKDHAPVTLHTFLKGFFDLSNTPMSEKFSRNDPGARFSAFNFSYRLPYIRRYATLYVDSIAHDDVSPISAPRRAAYRTGLYISQFPKLHKLDLRVEAVTTDPGVARSTGGQFNYFEEVQLQGYTNKGYIMGDWIGREAKGGQAWLTYHLSGNEWVQLEYLNKKTPKDFIPGGTTQNQFKATVVKRFGPDLELNAWVQYEGWKAPIYLPGAQNDNTFAMQVTFFPKLKTSAR